MIVFAHLGHWYIETPIYLGPILLVALWIKLSERRERRRAPRSEDDAG